MFERLHSYLESMGMGLSFVKHIVDKAGKNLLLKREPGKGSTFRTYLPAASYQPE